MPQLDPAYFTSQIFWLVVLFCIFYASVKYIVLPRLEDIINLRVRVKGEADEESGKLKLEIENLKDLQRKKAAETRAAIKGMQLDSDKKFQSYCHQSKEKLQVNIDKKIFAARQEIDESVSDLHSSKEVSEEVVKLAASIIREAASSEVPLQKLKKYG